MTTSRRMPQDAGHAMTNFWDDQTPGPHGCWRDDPGRDPSQSGNVGPGLCASGCAAVRGSLASLFCNLLCG